MTYHIVFDATDPKSPRFIELEDEHGKSINVGDWRKREDGYCELVLPAPSKESTQISVARPEYVQRIFNLWEGKELPLLLQYIEKLEGDLEYSDKNASLLEECLDPHIDWQPISPPKPLSYEGEQS